MAPHEQDMRYPPSKPSDEVAPEIESDTGDDELTPETPETSAAEEMLVDILRSVYRAEGMTAQGFAALRERLAAIEERLGLHQPSAAGEDSTTTNQSDVVPETVVAEAIPEQAAQPEQSAGNAMPVAQAPSPIPQPIQPVRDVRPVNVPHGHSELGALVFAQDLANHQGMEPQRQALLASVRSGDEDAIGLVGQLLIVRSATMDRLPTLLKDVGEAWYRWRADDAGGADPLRDAVIAWLHARLDAVGLGNRIELVRLGDRYDSKRHNAKARGVEVTGVQGWVVLRDNGNVYTKANVVVA